MSNERTTEENPLKAGAAQYRRRKYEFFVNDNHANKKHYKHKDNSIDTTKYNWATFLPKALLFQFMRLANLYFLFIAIIQSIPQVSPLGISTAWGPICFVLFVALVTEALIDLGRRKYDKMLNTETVTVYRDGQWVETKSGKLRLGEVILVKQNATLPSDMVLLDSNLKEGVAFIETGTLDGEKALKQKIGPKGVAGFFNVDGEQKTTFEIKGKVESDPPNPHLYELDCKLHLTISDTNGSETEVNLPCNAKQLLLKGAKLKNTKWVVGIVLYTGHNNKLILNSEKPRMKFSRIEYLMSYLLIVILAMQAGFCLICACLYTPYYNANVGDNPYLPKYQTNAVVDSVITYFTYLLLLNTMIPISLIISLDIVKMIQGYFIIVDVEGYSSVRKEFIKATTVTLNEELGNVNFIFSDKTGTLTCNKMHYKFGVIGDKCYEYVRDGENPGELKDPDITRVNKGFFSPSKFRGEGKTLYEGYRVASDANEDTFVNMETDAEVVAEYWKALALCHQCDVEKDEKGQWTYVAPSPDDIELVKTATAQGYDLQNSPVPTIRKVAVDGEEKDFELLHLIEFDSTRKRMSVIVKDGDKVKVYIKGADSAMEWIGRVEEGNKRISPRSREDFLVQAKNYMDTFSREGYRTLLLGMRVLDNEEYEEWAKKLYNAEMLDEGKKEAIEELYAEIERNIYILGATIVEDKLQDNVPETIFKLRLAGIKIWMITGDKIDTAFNIGLNCHLVEKGVKIFKIHGEKGERLDKLVDEFAAFHRSFPHDIYTILIDAVALAIILDEEERLKTFMEIAYHAKTVICCRVSPKQKSQVVKMVKDYDHKAVTLAIGDGGNDVSMITQAHIGVGMYGEEGMRAVQSGDYAIGEFKFLARLLLFHGRTNNIRISKMIIYFFYKNFIFTIVHFFYGFYNNFSGQTIIDSWFITFYNLLLTAFPLGVLAVADFDLKPDDGEIIQKLLPFLYEENNRCPIFTKWKFILSLFRGIAQALINFFFLVYLLDSACVDLEGDIGGLWYFSICLYSNIIFVSQSKT